jgi:urease gamma subunit
MSTARNTTVQQQPIINLEWLDEEVRRYRNELMEAQQRINLQDDEIREQARHIEDLEGRLAGVMTQLNRMNVLERALEQYKEEIRLLLEQEQENYQRDRREAARIKLIEQDNLNRSIADLRKGVLPLTQLQEELELRTAEDRRLNDAHLALRQKVLDMEKRFEVELRSISYLEEQRARSAKSVAQLQEQASNLLKRVDTMEGRVPVVEEIAHRNRQRIEELVTIRAELQGEQRRFLEEMQIVEQQRQRLVKEWAELEEAREQRMREFAEQMRLFTEQSQKAASTLSNLESLAERLQRAQHEVAELQRLSEERQRGRMEEWEAQSEKRWQREKLLWEQQWRDHDRRNAEQLERILANEARSTDNEHKISHLLDMVADDIRLRNEAAQQQMIKISEQVEACRKQKRP